MCPEILAALQCPPPTLQALGNLVSFYHDNMPQLAGMGLKQTSDTVGLAV